MKLTYVNGGDGSTSWGFDPDSGKVEQGQDRSIARLTPMGEEPVYGPDAFEGFHPPVGHWFDPHVGELLEPASLAYAGLIVEGLEKTTSLARDAVRVRARLEGWEGDRDPFQTYNLQAAEDYELVIDTQTGVVLRLSCGFDGQDFRVIEVREVAFDESLPDELFEPPVH